jgi:hypothetical protein
LEAVDLVVHYDAVLDVAVGLGSYKEVDILDLVAPIV